MELNHLKFVLILFCVMMCCCFQVTSSLEDHPKPLPSRTLSLNSLAAFAKRFWTTMANVVASESRLKRDSVEGQNQTLVNAINRKSNDDSLQETTTTSTTTTTTTTTTTPAPPPSASTGDLANQLFEMLAQLQEISTKAAVNSSSIASSTEKLLPSAILLETPETPTVVPPPPVIGEASRDQIDNEDFDSPPIDFSSLISTSIQDTTKGASGCNESTKILSIAEFRNRLDPPRSPEQQAPHEEIIAIPSPPPLTNPASVTENLTTASTTTALQASTTTTTALQASPTTTTALQASTTTPKTVTLTEIEDHKESPLTAVSEILNGASFKNNDTVSMTSIIKAITTAMIIVSENLENVTRTSDAGAAISTVTTTTAPVVTTEELVRAPLIDHNPGLNEVKLVSVPAFRTPSSGLPVQHQSPSATRNPQPSSFLPFLHSSQHIDDDDIDDHDGRVEHHRKHANVIVDDDDRFETAELVQDDDIKSLKKRKDGSNRFFTRLPVKNVTEEPGECFFDVTDQQELCKWGFVSQSSIKWSFGLGASAFMSGGPVTDSNGLPSGGYAFIDTSAGILGTSTEIQRASLESPKLTKTDPSGRCFTFWYNIGGLSSDRLRVLLVPEENYSDPNFATRIPTFSVIWERKDSTNSTWVKGEILYTFSRPHRLIFEGFARSGSDPRRKFQGFIAVDDFAMDMQSCEAFCTFEGISCGWENSDDDDDFNWQIGRGSLSHLTGPVRDHGDGPEGGYMFIDSAYPRRPGDVARLTSSELPSTVDGPVCLKFWTHMYGNGIGTLRVLQKEDDVDPKLIWEVSGESGNSWHMAQVTVSSPTDFKISLEGVVGKNALGSIAIDDIAFGPGPCPSSPQSALPSRGDCTYEADECGWINAGSGDQYDWLRTSSGQPLLPGQGPNSGYRPPEPLSDHTTGLSSGNFLTMERSTIPPRSGEQAYIVGPTLQGSEEGKCFSFWGYMHERSVDASGPGLGSLRIYLRIGTSSILRPIWRLINFEYPEWFFAQTPIRTSEKFQIVIGGTWGSTRQGAIAVDDFTFYDGNCSVVPAEAEVTPGECTFDSNMCEWTNLVNVTKDRTLWQLATNIRRPSNLDDHTYRATAGYVFFDIFSQAPHVVRLESPELIADNTTEEEDDKRCLTFWFAPFGSSRNTFLRIIQRNVASNSESQIWEVTTANFQVFRPEWTYGQVPITSNFTQKIVFEGSSNNGGFALDDIMFIPGNCHVRPPIL